MKTFFLFWRSRNFGRKKPLNCGKITLNFGEDFFFFWRSPNFGRKKALNFRAFRDISYQFSDKPSETDSRSMKNSSQIVCTLLTLSKYPPPFPNPGYAPVRVASIFDWRGRPNRQITSNDVITFFEKRDFLWDIRYRKMEGQKSGSGLACNLDFA